MLDKSFIGLTTPSRSVEVEKGQLKFFARATDETNRIYFDEAAAREAGHPALPAPPTFLMCLGSLAPDREDILGKLGVDIGRILHGEQHFTYLAPIYAGDVITLTTRVTDMYDKKGGALDFIVQETDATNQNGEKVGATRSTIVVRNT
jgi:acyl dehydratase